MGDAGKTPGGWSLGDIGLFLKVNLAKTGLHDGILLDILNLLFVSTPHSVIEHRKSYPGQVADLCHGIIGHISSKTAEVPETVDVCRVLLQ